MQLFDHLFDLFFVCDQLPPKINLFFSNGFFERVELLIEDYVFIFLLSYCFVEVEDLVLIGLKFVFGFVSFLGEEFLELVVLLLEC